MGRKLFFLITLCFASSLCASINDVLMYFVAPNPENPWEVKVGSTIWRRNTLTRQPIITTLPDFQGQVIFDASDYHFKQNDGFDFSVMKYFDFFALEFRVVQNRYFKIIADLFDPIPDISVAITFANLSLLFPPGIFVADTKVHSLLDNYEYNVYFFPRSCLRFFLGYRKFKLNDRGFFDFPLADTFLPTTIHMITKNIFQGVQIGTELHYHVTPQMYVKGVIKVARGGMQGKKTLDAVLDIGGVQTPAKSIGLQTRGSFLGEIAAGLGFELTCNFGVEALFSALRATRIAEPSRQFPVTNVFPGTVFPRDVVDQTAKLTCWGATIQAVLYW